MPHAHSIQSAMVCAQMAAVLAAYKENWAAMREHICLEARWGELGAQVAVLKGQDLQLVQERAICQRRVEQLREVRRRDSAAGKCVTPIPPNPAVVARRASAASCRHTRLPATPHCNAGTLRRLGNCPGSLGSACMGSPCRSRVLGPWQHWERQQLLLQQTNRRMRRLTLCTGAAAQAGHGQGGGGHRPVR